MLNTNTKNLTLLHLNGKENSWNKQPKEIIEDKIPVRLSESPNSLVRVARKEPAIKMDIKYSKVASKIYINLLRFKLFTEISFIN